MTFFTKIPVYWHLIISCCLAVALASFYGLCTQDDAFITFRYAENWAQGHGLVFNLDEKVEGYSNLSWTLLFGMLISLGLEPASTSVAIGCLSLVLLLWAVYRLAQQLTISPILPLWLIALDASMLLEAVEGLESVFYAALICWAVVLGLREADQGSRWHVRSTVLFALACLTRPEAPLLFGLFHLGLLWKKFERRQMLASVAAGCGVTTVLILLTLWRWNYYGELLPNTYYAKVGGAAWYRGLLYWRFHALGHPLLWLGVLCGVGYWNQAKSVRPLLLMAYGFAVYVLYIGGDFKHTSRFLLPISAFMAVLFSLFFHARYTRWKYLMLALLGLGLLCRGKLYMQSLQWAKIRRMNLVARKVVGDFIRQTTPANTVLAIHSVGVIPYYAQRKTIDMWGLTDKVIARTPVNNFGTGMAGHERQNPAYVFSLKPDIYLPEDQFFLPKRVTQTPEENFPKDFLDHYRPVSIPIEASWLNIWVRKGFPQDKTKKNNQ